MRQSKLVTVSLPTTLVRTSERIAKKQSMTRSELFRTALRQYAEGLQADEAIRVYEKEKREGKLRELRGSLASLLG